MSDLGSIRKGRPNWWKTEAEKNFIDGLGTFTLTRFGYDRRLTTQEIKERRLRLLSGHRKALLKRETWGDLDRKEILAYIDQVIDRLVRELNG